MVQRVQTSHLPDPFDPTPVLQGIGVYYTDLQWGGVSLRFWKTASGNRRQRSSCLAQTL